MSIALALTVIALAQLVNVVQSVLAFTQAKEGWDQNKYFHEKALANHQAQKEIDLEDRTRSIFREALEDRAERLNGVSIELDQRSQALDEREKQLNTLDIAQTLLCEGMSLANSDYGKDPIIKKKVAKKKKA